MCESIEDLANKRVKREIVKVAMRMIDSGKYSVEDIIESSGLSSDEVKELLKGKSA